MEFGHNGQIGIQNVKNLILIVIFGRNPGPELALNLNQNTMVYNVASTEKIIMEMI